MTHTPILLLLDALACFRLTWLITKDSITEPLRELARGTAYSSDRLLDGSKIPMVKRPKAAAFVTCPWCTSPYLAALIVLLQALCPAVWLYPSAILAFSAVAGFLSEIV